MYYDTIQALVGVITAPNELSGAVITPTTS